jgi:hypothetical protein
MPLSFDYDFITNDSEDLVARTLILRERRVAVFPRFESVLRLMLLPSQSRGLSRSSAGYWGVGELPVKAEIRPMDLRTRNLDSRHVL